MDKLLFAILNMSLTGAFVIIAIILARLVLKNVPKIISYCLWVVAGFRLLFPFSFESIFSLVPFNTAPIPPDIAMQPTPRIHSGVAVFDDVVSGVLPAAVAEQSANPLQIWTAVGTIIWLCGIIAMLVYGIASYIALKRRLQGMPCAEENIHESEIIGSPFVLGVLKPNIYLPAGLDAKEREYIILHEQTHIRRRDHIIKIVAYFALSLHWFNPLAWVAYFLMVVDMELSCDECVLKELSPDVKKDYSHSLIKLADLGGRRSHMLSANRIMLKVSPLAFSEDGLKTRIKNILKYKKRSRFIIVVAATLAIALGIGLALNGIDNTDYGESEADQTMVSDTPQPQYEMSMQSNNEGNHTDEENSAPPLPKPDEDADFIVIDGERIYISQTEVALNSLTVTDADLEMLKQLPNLDTLRIIQPRHPMPEYPQNGGIVNLDLISELVSVTRLQIRCDFIVANISDLSSMSKMGNLEALILGTNQLGTGTQITDLSPLENLERLESLFIAIPNVSDLSPLTRIPRLALLSITNTSLDDLSILAQIPNLTWLQFSSTSVIDLDFLTEMSSLRSLGIIETQISDLSLLSTLTNLVELNIRNCGLEDLSILSRLTNLNYLTLDNNPISDIRPLSGLENLRVLSITSAQVSDLSPLAELSSLMFLYLYDNIINDLSPLADHRNIAHLKICLEPVGS